MPLLFGDRKNVNKIYEPTGKSLDKTYAIQASILTGKLARCAIAHKTQMSP